MDSTRLPIEIIQKFAGLCPLGDILSLSATCRTLRSLCHDAFVFQESFLHHMSDPTSPQVPTKTALRDLIHNALAGNENAERAVIWARLAAAASRKTLLVDELDRLLQPYESVPWESTLPWPQPLVEPVVTIASTINTLTVLGYPTISDFTVTAALGGFLTHILNENFWQRGDPLDPLQTAQLSFCLATGAIGNRVLNNMSILSKRTAVFMTGGHDKCFLSNQATGFLAAACMPWLLGSDPAVNNRGDLPYLPALPLLSAARQGNPEAVSLVPLPDGAQSTCSDNSGTLAQEASNMTPLVSSMRGFTLAPSWQSWLRATVDALIDGIGEGEWIGYYTNAINNDREVDPPLGNIHFSILPDSDDENRLLLTANDCIDRVGRFRLRGDVSRETSRVRLMKEYYNAHSWYNQGWLTPLGIAGYWGFGPDRALGFIWMYKKDWARRPTSKKARPVSDGISVPENGDDNT